MMKWINKLSDYFRGDGRGHEANGLEREALTDPFLYEAMEGLSSVEGGHEKILNELNARLRENVERKNHRMPYYRWMVAASLLLIGGVAVWLLRVPEELQETEALVVRRENVVMDSSAAQGGMSVVAAGSMPVAASSVNAREKEKAFSSPLMPPEKGHSVVIEKMAMAEMVADVAMEANENQGKPIAEERKSPLAARKVETVMELLRAKLDSVTLKKGSPNTVYIRGISDAKPVAQEQVISYDADKRKDRRSSSPRRGDWHHRTGKKQSWQQQFDRYVTDSIRYPEEVRRGKVEGDVLLTIRLNKQRFASRIKVVKGLSPECDREALRLVEFYQGVLGDENARKVELTIPFRLKKSSH